MEIVKEYPNLFNKSFCDFLIETASNRLEPAKTVGPQIEGYRVAEYCWVGDLLDNVPQLTELTKYVSHLTGLPIENQEDIHIVKYSKGGEYKIHHDYFYDNEEELSKGGDREYSFLIYLNDDFEGGETEFPQLNKKIKPEIGKGVLWKNLYEDGYPIIESEHAGLPVESGTKWILIIWIREAKFQ